MPDPAHRHPVRAGSGTATADDRRRPQPRDPDRRDPDRRDPARRDPDCRDPARRDPDLRDPARRDPDRGGPDRRDRGRRPAPGARPGPPSRGRPRARRRPLVAAATVALFAAVAWLLLASPVLGARSVAVTGLAGLTEDEVRAAAAVPTGTPLLRLDTDAVAERVAGLDRVADVAVRRSIGGTVHVAVTERIAVAAVLAPDGAHLVDATATDFAVEPAPPRGVPELRVARAAPDDPASAAAVAVLTGLPADLRARVAVVAAASAADVVLLLADGREVRWGGAADGARKAAVLPPLLTRPGQVYDVSSPDLPTTR